MRHLLGLAAAILMAMAATGCREEVIRPRTENPAGSPSHDVVTLDDPALPQISAGGSHACGVTTDRRIVCWGAMERVGQTPAGSYLQVEAGFLFTCALRVDHEAICWGESPYYPPGPPPLGPFSRLVATNNGNACAIRPDGTVACWANHDIGQVPTGTFQKVVLGIWGGPPNPGNGNAPCGLRTDGTITCWGSGGWDPARLPGTYIDLMAYNSTATQSRVCGLRPDNTVLCSPMDYQGQEGLSPTDHFLAIDARGWHSACGLRTDSTIVCHVPNGPGDMPPGENHSFVAVSSDEFNACGLRKSGLMLCWGDLPGSVSLVANAAGGPYFGVEGSPVQFAASAGYSTYVWDFGDASSGSGPNPTHTYLDNRTYDVTLTLTGGPGPTTATTTVMVANAPPVVTAVSVPPTIVVGVPFSVTISFSDPGPADGPWGLAVYGADGSAWSSVGSTPSTTVAGLVASSSGDLEFQVQLLDKDDNGGRGNGLTWATFHVTAVDPNTSTGSGVTVAPIDPATGASPVTMGFENVTSAGVTTVTSSSGGTPPPLGFKLGSPATYFDVATTATFSGSVSVCFTYTSVSYGNENSLKLLHFQNGSWTNITNSLNIANDQICGAVTSFSPFVVAEQFHYTFAGFYQPVDNLPTVNVAKSGSAIPVKFSLAGASGLNIFAAGYPAALAIACDSGAPVADVELTVAASTSSLSYDVASGQYSYVWKTDKKWVGTCRQLVLKFADASEYRANFKFK